MSPFAGRESSTGAGCDDDSRVPQLHLVENNAVCPDVRKVQVTQTFESFGTAWWRR